MEMGLISDICNSADRLIAMISPDHIKANGVSFRWFSFSAIEKFIRLT